MLSLTFGFDETTVDYSNNKMYNKRLAYAHFFQNTENAVTKSVDERYKVSFLPYPATPLVNDTSTKLNFSVTENNTDAFNLFTSLAIVNKNTQKIVKQTPYEFHEFGDVTYPHTFTDDGRYNVAIQAKINGDPKYGSQPLIASFDVEVQNMQDRMSTFQQIMLFYVIPALAAVTGFVIYARNRSKGIEALE
jgi:hypothetical protein